MAAAYAALISLTHIIEQTMDHHARHPIFSDNQQRQIQSLQQKVSFLIDFLELLYSNGGSSNNNKAQEGLESRIAHAAYAAEDIIESHVVDKILLEKSSNHFSQGLQKVIGNIDRIRKEVTEIKEKSRVEDQQPNDPVPVVSSRPPTTGKDTMMEYYDDDLEEILDKLTGQSSILQIIPIVGMGGIGKTTLARNVYENPLIVECFYIRAWVTISQEYNLLELLFGLLHETGVPGNKTEQESSEYHQLGQKLHKHLSGRKYMIIMDDMWSFEAWEKLKLFLPDNNNGSRVMITTRLSNIANSFGSSYLYKMNLLDENKSWSLLRRKVFGHGANCPLELEEIGKDISKNCKGLPLAIVVIGGLLAKSDMSRKYWENVAKDINQIINSADDGHWLKILYLSYSHLPIHLKSCFLYMGVYPEDYEIYISKLIKLWVVEGFIKPNKSKSLEEVGKDYLKDLIGRNLILVRKWGSIGKMKTCSIHDILRDLCLKEAQKEMFLCVINKHNQSQPVNNERRIVYHGGLFYERDSHQFQHVLQSAPLIRSLTCDFLQWSSSWRSINNLRLLRVLTKASTHNLESILQQINLRYLKCGLRGGASVLLLAPMCRLWYLQILVLKQYKRMEIVAPNEIWKMPQLRHIIIDELCLPDPSPGRTNGHEDDCFVLKNLQTLSWIKNFNCTEDMLQRIPNIKKLWITNEETGTSTYCLHNLGRLHKLQSLTCHFSRDTNFFQNIAFSKSLIKLRLWSCYLDWDGVTEKVGSLPHLEKLRLSRCHSGAEWMTIEGKFPRLKFLEISMFDDLVCWTADSSHFPLLERLVLKFMYKLKEIPSGIGDTLQTIELAFCGRSVITSAKEILEEQHSLGNEGLRLTVSGDPAMKTYTTIF